MAALAIPGVLLLFLGPVLARLFVRRGDWRALARFLQAAGVAMIVAALLVRPVRDAIDDRGDTVGVMP